MTKTITIIFLGILAVASIGAFTGSFELYEFGEAEDEAHEYRNYAGGERGSPSAVIRVQNETYQNECGECHFAYQPGLLPGAAWLRIMDQLENHYGDDASLGETVTAELRDYLMVNSTDRGRSYQSAMVGSQSQASDALPRITETHFFKYEHHEIPLQFVKNNKEIAGFGNCLACHRGAKSAVYDEHQVVIPGIGRWDD